MEYDVTGTLKIDTEAFEKALKEAQSRIDSFRKDLESLGNIAKEMGFPELKKSLDNIDKSLDDVKADFGKVEKSADNVTKSVENLKKKTDNATKSTENLKKATSDVATQGKKAGESIKALDEYFEQATTSAKKTGAEVDALQRKIKRLELDRNFTKDFYRLVSKAEGGNGVELKPIYNQLESKYKQLVKTKAEFEKLFTRAVQRTNTRLYPSRDSDKFVNVGGRNFGYIDRKQLITLDEYTAKLDKVNAKIKELKGESVNPLEGWDRRLYDANQELVKLRKEAKKVKQEFGEDSPQFKNISKDVDKAVKKVQELDKLWAKIHPIEWVSPKSEGNAEKLEKEIKEVTKDLKQGVETSKQLDESFDQATSSAKKTGLEAEKLKQKLRNIVNPITSKQGLATILSNKAQAELDKYNDFFNKTQDRIMKLKEERASLMDLWSDLQIKQEKAQEGLEKYGDGNRWSKKWKEDLKTIPPEIDKVKAKYESLENEVERLENEIIESGKSYKKITDPLYKSIISLQKESKKLGKMVSEPVKKGTSEATKEMSEFDRKMKEQFDGLNKMLVEAGQMSVEQARLFGTQIVHSLDTVGKKANEITKNIRGRMNLFYKNYGGKSGKWFTEPSFYGQESNRWVHEQLSTTRNFFKGFTQGFAKLKKEQSESVTWMKELQVKMNELRYGSRDFLNTQEFQKAKVGAEEYIMSLDKVKAKMNLMNKYKPVQFNKYGAGFLGDANIQKDIQLVNEYHRVTREVSASTNQWVNESITDFNRFSQSFQKSFVKAREEMQLLHKAFASTGNKVGVGFAGSTNFQQINKGMQEYNRLSNIANLNTNRMGLGFEKFGQYSQKATSNIRSLSGVLRTLRTTMSMIGGMFVWEFAFRIMDSARATISAKSEMESYYKTLNMGSTEIASFNKQLDKTVSKFQKMNKFQLGETISALGVEFKMSTEEMNQIMKVAPMIVNEYLRAGRSTEEAILAIKDISQGEFLRLSRETGVGKKEIKEAGWSGDNKDIISLYKALEKIGTARHWDVFASKAQSLNDVMLITENRMTEFMTLLSDAVTPIIVGSFNALGSAFNSASKWYESLPVADKIYAQLTVLGGVVLTTATVFNNHLLPAIQNFGNTLISSFLGVDGAIAKEKGLAQAIAHETAVERIANIERANGQRVLNAKIMTLKSEELANKLGMSTTKLRTRYEKLQNQALRISEQTYKARGTAERMDILVNKQGMTVEQARTKVTKARTLAQRSLILAEEQGITTTQAMTILMEEEALAEMGTLKALMVRKLGLDATIVSEQGMVVALNERLAQSIPYVTSLVAETLATLGLEGATLTLVATLGLLLAPLIALGVAITPLIVQFAELQSSYERVNDVLTGGQERIDSLVEKKKSLEKTEQSLAEKTNRTTQENQKLNQTRQDLEATTLALKSAEEELAEAQKFDDARSSYTTKVEANRYKNLQEINDELKTNYGVNEDVLSQTASMDKAYRDMTKHMQVANWLENHRADRFEEFNKRVKEGSSTQEEYNQKIKDLGNDWNMAYTDMENAQIKMTDPELSGWDRFWTNMDYHFAKFKMNWVEFLGDPLGEFSQFESNIKLGSILPIMTPLNDMKTGDIFNGVKNAIDKAGKDFEDWLNTTASDWGQKWDDFWQPIRDFFDGLSVDTSYDPFSGVKEWWSSTNDWLESLLPDISVDDIKEWVRTKIKEPFQKAFSEFMKNPFGSSDKEQQNSGTAKKTISLGSMFNFNFGAFKSSFTTKFRNVFSGASDILQNAGQLWSRLTGINASKVVQSTKEGLSNLKGVVSQKFEQGKQTISSFASKWGRSAYSTGSSIYNNLRNGIGDLKGIIKDKFNGIKEAIDGVKKKISGSVQAVANAITAPFENMHLPISFGGLFGYGNVYGHRPHRPHRNRRIRVRGSSPTPAFGSSNIGFETVLRTMLTSQGFRSPSSYQFYPNHQKTTQEAWDSGKANCFDGASLILALGSMFGLKGHLVMGDWNGTGHTGAVIGGKLYDMTQFQRRGVFRGTSGVHFGSRQGKTYGNGQMKTTKVVNINVTNDLSNAQIYGMDDLDNHIEKATERTFYRLNSVDGALGY